MRIEDVWDYRLSTAAPLIDRRSGTWVVQIWSKNNPDYDPAAGPARPLEEYDTGIPFVPGDEHDEEKISICYDWLLSVRDKYSRPDIEELKPVVARIRKAQAELAARGAA